MNPDESEINPGTSILFTGLESQMENTDSVNELRSYSVISPCLFIVGSKDDRKTKYTAMSCQTDCRRSDRVEAVLTVTVKLAITSWPIRIVGSHG